MDAGDADVLPVASPWAALVVAVAMPLAQVAAGSVLLSVANPVSSAGVGGQREQVALGTVATR
jgi:hypothetical protein